MAQNEAGQSLDDEPLKNLFEEAMAIFNNVEETKEATNSDSVQMSIKAAIKKFEKATNLVSLSGMFSKNETIEEIPTETLQYLLLPALLGTLSLKICGQPRKDVVDVAEVYFRDFIQRCKDYEVTNIDIPQSNSDCQTVRPQNELGKIANMVQSREDKIKHYREMKEIQEKLATLTKSMSLPQVDDETKREYFMTLLQNYIQKAIDEIKSIEQEKPILEYMAKHAGEPKPKESRPRPLKPVIIAKDAVQKAVFGAGYPAIPAMTVEEFYDQRVREGTFPASGSNIAHTTIQNTESNADEEEDVRKERLAEEDDPEELARQRNFDEYKDDHRRGWGNRYNRS